MNTVGIGLENLCVPCRANCAYCLLSSCNKATGVPYERGKSLAQRLLQEQKQQRPDLSFTYYIGFCMDTPHLNDYIRFCQENKMPSGNFLQMNGLSIRDAQGTKAMIDSIKQAGVQLIDLTFYGTCAHHDAFAGRKGDFDFLLRMLRAASHARLPVQIGIALYKSNLAQIDPLLQLLSAHHPKAIRIFLPHSKGRGWLLEHERITMEDFETLSARAKALFSAVPHATEQEWLEKNQWEQSQKRILTLCPTPQNIDILERAPLCEIIDNLEKRDDLFLSQMPSLPELARLYGRPENQQLFRLRDLHLIWQQKFLRDHPEISDMHDESRDFSIHF